jgi:hypothetical protein
MAWYGHNVSTFERTEFDVKPSSLTEICRYLVRLGLAAGHGPPFSQDKGTGTDAGL